MPIQPPRAVSSLSMRSVLSFRLSTRLIPSNDGSSGIEQPVMVGNGRIDRDLRPVRPVPAAGIVSALRERGAKRKPCPRSPYAAARVNGQLGLGGQNSDSQHSPRLTQGPQELQPVPHQFAQAAQDATDVPQRVAYGLHAAQIP